MAKEAWYVSQRSEDLAVLLFTRLKGVGVTRPAWADQGVDFVLALSQDPKEAHWRVGARVKGFDGPPQAPILFTRHQKAYLANVDLPVFLLAIDVRDEKFYFGWLNRPGKGAQLERLDDPSSVQLSRVTTAQLARQLELAKRYYTEKDMLVLAGANHT